MVKHEHLRSGCDAEKSTALRAQDEQSDRIIRFVQRQQPGHFCQKWTIKIGVCHNHLKQPYKIGETLNHQGFLHLAIFRGTPKIIPKTPRSHSGHMPFGCYQAIYLQTTKELANKIHQDGGSYERMSRTGS